ncbi:MAG: OmpA family protein [Rhodobacterales bacterium]|nr:OmpA family protein [Rhodobacterales bacterium]
MLTTSVLLAMLAPAAYAQQAPEINSQLYRPVMDSRQTLWADSSGIITPEITGNGRLFLNYANRPLVFTSAGSTDTISIVSDALALNVLGMASYGRVRLGIDLPIYLLTASQVVQGGAGTGDLSLDARVTALEAGNDIGVALNGRITLPTASVEASLGSQGVSGEILAIADKQLEDVYLTANLGTRFAAPIALDNVDVGSQFLYRLGGGYAIDGTDAGVSLDLAGNVNYTAPLSNPAGSPLEVLGGGWCRGKDDAVMRRGRGKGWTPGVGSPMARVVMSVAYEHPADRDTDADGLVDRNDACPEAPEDVDRFQDEDGCPDLDNDQDGIADLDDSCKNRPEDLDGYAYTDGCPDASVNIRISVQDQEGEAIPEASVSITGPQSQDGVHGLDADLHEGRYKVSASASGYVTSSVSFDAPEETDVVIVLPFAGGLLMVDVLDPEGKPVPAAEYTLDGTHAIEVANGHNENETMIGEHIVVVRADGYAPYKERIRIIKGETTNVVALLQRTKVKVTREKIDIQDKVFFETGKTTIKSESFSLLDEVAQILIDHPELLKIRIEGHTDSRGSESTNQRLSEGRAKSVKNYMADQGVAPERLDSIGYGESKPVDPANNSAAWDANRRVEFFIQEREEVE